MKRLGKAGDWNTARITPGNVCTLYKADGAMPGDWETQLTGVCVVGEKTLMVVVGNCVASLIDLSLERRFHSFWFSSFRPELALSTYFRSLLISAYSNRLFFAVWDVSRVYEIEWARAWPRRVRCPAVATCSIIFIMTICTRL